MRSLDAPLFRALVGNTSDIAPADRLEADAGAFTVRLSRRLVTADTRLPDGSVFRVEAQTNKYDDGEFRISRADAATPLDAALLCVPPKGAWGWASSDEMTDATAAAFRRLAEIGLAAITLAAPGLITAKQRWWWARGIHRRGQQVSRTEGGRLSGSGVTQTRGTCRQVAVVDRNLATGGPVGQSGPAAAAAVSEDILARILDTAARAVPLPEAARPPKKRHTADTANHLNYRCLGTCSRVVASRSLLRAGAGSGQPDTADDSRLSPAEALGVAPDPADAVPAGDYCVYDNGGQVSLLLREAGIRATAVSALLYVYPRALRAPRCALVFGGRWARFDRTAQIGDPVLRALAGLMLRAREIALLDIAAAPAGEASHQRTADEATRRAAASLVGQMQSAPTAVGAPEAAGHAAPAEGRKAGGGQRQTARQGQGGAVPGSGACLLCGSAVPGHACRYAPLDVHTTAQPPEAAPRRPDTAGVLGTGLALSSAAAATAAAGVLAGAALTPGILGVLIPLSLASAAGAAVAGAVRRARRRAPGSTPAPAATPEPDPRDALRASLLRASGRIPAALDDRLRRLWIDIEAGLDRAGADGQDAYILRESALRYLPDAIDGYLALPADAPRTLTGRTPEQELGYQVGVIEDRVRQALDGEARGLVGGFDAHGRFLQERLAAAKAPVGISRPAAAR
jgi:hypothetical protein